MPKTKIAVLALVATVTMGVLSGCSTGIYVDPCAGSNCLGIRIKFERGLGNFSSLTSISANSLYETREVDPSVYTHDSQIVPSGVVTVTLTGGSTVTYQGTLYLDPNTNPVPRTPGFRVLVYRPSDPGSLQDFIDQYEGSMESATIETRVGLRDISDGTVSSSHVDVQGNYDGSLRLIGSSGTVPPSYGIFHRDV